MATGTGVLVTGADGQVGRALRAYLPDARRLSRSELDIRDRDALDTSLREARVVVHLAAMTNVDACEREPELATSINDTGTRNVAEIAAEHGARVIYVSTDYVFDGAKRAEYVEDDQTRPLNVYGTTKLAGEAHVRSAGNNLVVRTSWVFGDGSNFVRTIGRLAGERAELAVVDDQKGRPTPAADLARTLVTLIERKATGVIHVAGGGPAVTWADLAARVVELSESPAKIRRVTSEEYAAMAAQPPAPRPRNSTLSLKRLQDAWGIEMPEWEPALTAYLGAAA